MWLCKFQTDFLLPLSFPRLVMSCHSLGYLSWAPKDNEHVSSVFLTTTCWESVKAQATESQDTCLLLHLAPGPEHGKETSQVHIIGETLQNALMVRLRPTNLHTCDIKTCIHPSRMIVHIQSHPHRPSLSSILRGGFWSQGTGRCNYQRSPHL